MARLVEHMLSLHKKLADARTDHDRNFIQHQIDATDRLVYELYGLTEEVAVVEGK